MTGIAGAVDRALSPFAAPKDKPCLALNQNTTMLKWLALILMTLDHAGAMLWPMNYTIRMIGRVSFPLFCWCLVVGADHTRNIVKYALRLLGLAAVSQPFFMLALNHRWDSFNIFLTLFLGLVGIAGIQRKHYEIPLLVLVLSCFVDMDYGTRGVLVILVMYMLRRDPALFTLGFTLFCIAWGSDPSIIPGLTPGIYRALTRFWGRGSMTVANVMATPVKMQSLAAFALPFILIPMRKRWKTPGGEKWLYWFYPAHLGILYVIKRFIL